MSGSKPKAKVAPRTAAPQPISPALRRAIAAADWIAPTDEGSTKLAIRLARDLDRCSNLSDLASIANALQRSLKALGLSPEGRPGGLNQEEEEDPIAKLRSITDGPNRAKDRNAAHK